MRRTLALLSAVVLAAAFTFPVVAASLLLSMQPGDTATVTCPTRLTQTSNNNTRRTFSCRAASPTPLPTATPTPTPTPTATPTPTPTFSGLLNGASIYHKRTADLDLAVAAGLDTVRLVNWLDESSGGNPYDAGKWAALDGLIAGAESRGLKVLLDLSTYRNQLLAKGLNPYSVDWRPFLDFSLARYATRISIVSVALAGEPEAPNGSAALRPTSIQLTGFYRDLSAYWRARSSIPIHSGGLLHYGWNSGIDWRAIFDATGTCAVHVYSEGDISYLPTIDAYCGARPFLIEEFGQPQAVGDAARAAYYRRIYGLADGYGASVLFWNLGPETVSGSHDVNPSTPLTWAAVQEH